MIFAARQLQKKCKEQHSDLFVTFVYVTKVFDTVRLSGATAKSVFNIKIGKNSSVTSTGHAE